MWGLGPNSVPQEEQKAPLTAQPSLQLRELVLNDHRGLSLMWDDDILSLLPAVTHSKVKASLPPRLSQHHALLLLAWACCCLCIKPDSSSSNLPFNPQADTWQTDGK